MTGNPRLAAARDAAMRHGPTMAYLKATQPGWITALVWLAAGALIIGGIAGPVMCIHMIATDARDPNMVLAMAFAFGIVTGMALLVPMLVFRAVTGLPFVFEHAFVKPGSLRLLPVWGAYVIVFGVSVPLLLDAYGGRSMPDVFKDYGRLLIDLHGMLRWFF